MKKIIMSVIFAAAMSGGVLFAQNGMWQGPWVNAEKINASGVLGIARGQIVLKSGDLTYYVPGLNRFSGFIDGLKEGASAQVEGYGSRGYNTADNEVFMRVTKLTLNGKDYDLDITGGTGMGPQSGGAYGGMYGGGMRGMHGGAYGGGMGGMMPRHNMRHW